MDVNPALFGSIKYTNADILPFFTHFFHRGNY